VLARELKKAGAKEIYMAFASPPVVEQCDLGIDMRNKKDLPAAEFKELTLEKIEEKISEIIKVDKVIYLPIEKTAEAMGGKKEDFYYSPFGGPHPIRDKQYPLPQRKRKIIGDPRIAVFASGISKGKNLGKIIDAIELGDIKAKIINVLANTKDSPSITRSEKHKIPTSVIPFLGKFSDKSDRKNYEEKLVKHIEKIKPDLLLLSGWDFILSDFFVKKLQDLQIPIINHHPALLPTDDSDTVQTSKGRIPVVRGNNKFKASFETPALVSGLSVHQILPGNFYDVGPLVMKAEVRKRPDDTLESWEERNREMEYLLLPTAIKRILHVMKNNIDISKGEFIW
jgi:folate-dependent phosphoribosylglycinamide formyltransferase PurN